ncbi:class F sortase [Micromonospora sp. NPDC049559]|uniref:class F sortase n=1 Tax=Micromonospora sp. NPDC049559 TaxID=3155923 RepID=UPI003435389E
MASTTPTEPATSIERTEPIEPPTGPASPTEPPTEPTERSGVLRRISCPGIAAITIMACAAAGTLLGIATYRPDAPTAAPAPSSPARADRGDTPALAGAGPAGPAAVGPGAAGGATPGPRTPAGNPTRIRVPRIGLDAVLVTLGLDRAGRLAPPADFTLAGWYGGGPAPGDTGPAVIAGHLDSRDGPAVFARVPQLRPGDRIEVQRGLGRLTFRVTATGRYAKNRFPTDAVYGPTPGPELRLVTCGGGFDRREHRYRDNVVVFAVADPPPGPGA